MKKKLNNQPLTKGGNMVLGVLLAAHYFVIVPQLVQLAVS